MAIINEFLFELNSKINFWDKPIIEWNDNDIPIGGQNSSISVV